MEVDHKESLPHNGRGRTPLKNGLRKTIDSSGTTNNHNVTAIPNKRGQRKLKDEAYSSEEECQLPNGSPPGWVFKYYKNFGEYWEVFPKTDYTYLPSSPFNGRAIAPGVPIVPNMSRPGIKRMSSPPPSHHLNHYRDGLNYRLRFEQKTGNSDILQNLANFKRRSGWERVKDVWTSFWSYIYRIIFIVYTTVVSTITTIAETTVVMSSFMSSRNKTMEKTMNNNDIMTEKTNHLKNDLIPVYVPKRSRKIFWFWLLPFLLMLFLLLSHSQKEYLESIADEEGVNSYLIPPVLRLLSATSDMFSLITRSLVMIPSLIAHLSSLISYLALLPFQELGRIVPSSILFWYGAVENERAGSTPSVMGGKFDHVTLDDIRSMVIQVLEERGIVQKSDHDEALYALDNKIRFAVEDLSKKMREASAETRLSSDSRLEELGEYLKGTEAKMERAIEESLKLNEKSTLEPVIARILENGGGGLRQTVEAVLKEKTSDIESLVRETVVDETTRGNHELSRHMQSLIALTLDSWQSEESQRYKLQWKAHLEEWGALVERLELRIAELERTTPNAEVLTLELNDLRKNSLEAMQLRLKELEILAESSRRESGGASVFNISLKDGTMNSTLLQWVDVQKFILTSIEKVISKYHADRTGLPDYALQSSGGYVVSIRCTNTYPIAGRKYLFGIPLWDMHTSPDTILKPGIMPGECWAFVGSQGYAVIKLAVKIHITAFTMEHTPKELATHGHIKSAPQDFSVYGLIDENDEEPVHLGSFKFLDNGESLQQFEAIDEEKAFDMVELKIKSNQGNLEYTCVYRFRVHGIPVQA